MTGRPLHVSSGAVVCRRIPDGLEVLIMHRTKTATWHLPKGTQNQGETLEETARREVKEETGLEVELDGYLGKLYSTYVRDNVVHYKETHYFLARPVNGNITDHDYEHDHIEFTDFDTALERLEKFPLHEKEGEILRAFVNRLPVANGAFP